MEKLKILTKLSQLQELKDYIKSNDFIAFDTETTGIEYDSQIIGMSFSADTDLGYYVILQYWDPETKQLKTTEIVQQAKELCQLLINKNLIVHNGTFDSLMVLRNYGIDLMPYLHTDTMILAHLLDENRACGLKELGVSFFGEDAKAEQAAMKASVLKNGGAWIKKNKEMYKADAELMAKYGAKDAILTIKLFYVLVEDLYKQGLDKFFYEEESMPLLRGPTYDLNSTGLKVDGDKLQKIKAELQAECLEALSFIDREVQIHIKEQFKKFNVNSGDQLAWLLYIKLGNSFNLLTDSGKEICKALGIKIPYSPKDKINFISCLLQNKDRVYKEAEINPKTGKLGRPKKISDPWKYMSTDADSLKILAPKYDWVKKLLFLKKSQKLLSTYVEGIESKVKYGIIRPSFLQHGTTSGRYSSRDPNFQNLPKKDKRIKSFIVAREGKVFVGADYAQLEPRVFASVSKDETLISCFDEGKDFYSVVGAPIFNKNGCSLFKGESNSFDVVFPDLRDKSKVVALATPYGRTANYMASEMNVKREVAQALMDKYFLEYPKVELMMLESHEQAKTKGIVYSIFGRPRRIPEATDIPKIYGTVSHSELPYSARTLLNLAMNHRVQSSGASIVNRAAVAFCNSIKELGLDVKIVLQVHDELVVECPEDIANEIKDLLKYCMEETVRLPGVKLIAEPKIAKCLADLK